VKSYSLDTTAFVTVVCTLVPSWPVSTLSTIVTTFSCIMFDSIVNTFDKCDCTTRQS
jgi:hypothetical protein